MKAFGWRCPGCTRGICKWNSQAPPQSMDDRPQMDGADALSQWKGIGVPLSLLLLDET